MLKIKVKQKQRTAKQAELKKLRARRKQLRADEAALETQIEEAEDVSPELETKIDELSAQLGEVNDAIEAAQDAIDTLDSEIAAMEEDVEDVVDEAVDEDDGGERSRKPFDRRTAVPSRRSAPAARNFACRSRCFVSRAERDSFYARGEVKDWLGRVRSLAVGAGSRRAVTGAELTIPEVVLDLMRDNLNQYSKLISKVRLRHVRGKARQQIMGEVPEGVWTEMVGVLNELEFGLTELEVDGFKVGGFIFIDNSTLQDSDLELGEEIIYNILQAIGLALDKAIVYGLGPNSKMPVGIVTRLAETSEPAYWSDKRDDWTDLHSSHILKLNLATSYGTDFFTPLLMGLKKARRKLTSGDRLWIMNEETRDDILIRSLGVDAGAALVSGMQNTMPILGGEIITLEFIPDYEIVGGYTGEYLAVERDGSAISRSDQVKWLEDKTGFKGTARYDGQPIRGEAFVAVNYNNTAVTTEVSFKPDYANTKINSLIVTAAAGTTTGKTVLTVAGAVSETNALYAIASGAQISVAVGETIKKADWKKITSGTTQIEAAAGVGITVVELDGDDRVISLGYVASVPKTE